ncbi:MAG: DAK2 domain-containing protein [Acidimicrobiia bacterium]
MTTTTTDHAQLVRAVVTSFRDAVRANQAALNRLNVYPVPDGDTGTNMARTLDAVVEELDTVPNELAAVCKAISHGSLMGARGNSGVILSQILRGLSDTLRNADMVDAAVLAEGLDAAADAAYSAVLKPIEGTILTVARAAGLAAKAAVAAGADLLGVVEAASASAEEALARTPELLPVLADAGVVDAGGAGYVLLLGAALQVIDGRAAPKVDMPLDALMREPPSHHAMGVHAHDVDHEPSVADLRYEVMFFLDLPSAEMGAESGADEAGALGAFKQSWGAIGDSIVIVGGEGLYNCHVHTNDIGAAIEAALDCGGRPSKIRVTDLFEEVDAEHAAREAGLSGSAGVAGVDASIGVAPRLGAPVVEPSAVAVVAVAAGRGLIELFGSLGVAEVVGGGQTMNPSTAELLTAVERAPAPFVIVLPNNKNIVPVAEQLDRLTAKRVVVVPTVSMPEALASLINFDPEGDGDAVASAMRAALSGVRSGELTRAVRDARSDVGEVRTGDWIGLVRGDGIVSVSPDLVASLRSLLAALVDDDSSLVTLIEGDGASDLVTESARDWLSEHFPDIEVEVHKGAQPLYPYLVGVE